MGKRSGRGVGVKSAFVFFKYLDPFQRDMRLTLFGAWCYFWFRLSAELLESK